MSVQLRCIYKLAFECYIAAAYHSVVHLEVILKESNN